MSQNNTFLFGFVWFMCFVDGDTEPMEDVSSDYHSDNNNNNNVNNNNDKNDNNSNKSNTNNNQSMRENIERQKIEESKVQAIEIDINANLEKIKLSDFVDKENAELVAGKLQKTQYVSILTQKCIVFLLKNTTRHNAKKITK